MPKKVTPEHTVLEPARGTPISEIKTTDLVSLVMLGAEIVRYVPKKGKPFNTRADDLIYYLECNYDC